MNKKLPSKVRAVEPPALLSCTRNGRPNGKGISRLSVVEAEDRVTQPVPDRLPGYHLPTQRVESAAFFMLELIGVALILVAAGNALRFSDQRDSIAAALSAGTTIVSSGAAHTNHVLTNLTVIPAAVGRMRVGSNPAVSHQS